MPPYAPDAFWNVPIGANPAIDPNSSAIITYAIAGVSGSSNFANTNTWGRPVYLADSGDKLYTVKGGNQSLQVRIPAGSQPSQGSDHHMVIVYLETGQEFDFFGAVYNAAGDTWSATWVGELPTGILGIGAMCLNEPDNIHHCNGAVAAGFAAFGGQAMPEEFKQGHIDHALALTTPRTKTNLIACPATHTDGKDSGAGAIPEGGHIQLDPAFVIPATWAPWQKVLAEALQRYGAYISDTGGSLSLKGEAADLDHRNLSWAGVGVPVGPSLGFLPWSRFRMLQIVPC